MGFYDIAALIGGIIIFGLVIAAAYRIGRRGHKYSS